MQKATFAAGCFWGVEEAFRCIKGVKSTLVGYTGGHTKDPDYKKVCSGSTGHAEALLVEFDPKEVSYGDLLDIFWDIHDPTAKDRQGPDIGSQYRSVIFYHTPEQKEAAEKSKQRLQESGAYKAPVVTSIEPAKEFYPAEDYHQRYLEKRGLSSCHL